MWLWTISGVVVALIAGNYLWEKYCVVPEDKRDPWGLE